jgi:hypothetical protein
MSGSQPEGTSDELKRELLAFLDSQHRRATALARAARTNGEDEELHTIRTRRQAGLERTIKRLTGNYLLTAAEFSVLVALIADLGGDPEEVRATWGYLAERISCWAESASLDAEHV